MDSTRNHLESQEPPRVGLGRDLQRLRRDGAATAGELRQFLGQMRGRSPQEVMGIVAQSSLVQSIAIATVGCAVLLAVGTVIPYLMPGPQVDLNVRAAETPAADTNEAAQVDANANPDAGTEGTQASTGSNLENAANAMGIGEAAKPDQKTDELDNKLDKLLEGID